LDQEALETNECYVPGGSDDDGLRIAFRVEKFAVQGKSAGEVKKDFPEVVADVSVCRSRILVSSAQEKGWEHPQQMVWVSVQLGIVERPGSSPPKGAHPDYQAIEGTDQHHQTRSCLGRVFIYANRHGDGLEHTGPISNKGHEKPSQGQPRTNFTAQAQGMHGCATKSNALENASRAKKHSAQWLWESG